MNFNKFQFAGKPQAPVLAEKGEVFKTPDGDIQQIASHAPSHDDGEQVSDFGIKSTSKGNGGVVVDADSVLSDSYSQVSTGNRKNSMKEQIVKIKAEEGEIIASQLGLDIRLKKSVSPSKLFLEIQEAKDKIALKIMKASEKTQKTRESSNSLEANQAQLMSLPTDEEIYEAVFHTQEERKENSFLDFDEESTSQYGGSTYVQKPINPFQIQKNQRDILEEEWNNRQSQLSPTKKTSPAIQQYYKNEQAKKEANERINNRQNITNAAGMALAPVPVLGEIYNTANTIANGIVDVAQGEYADAVMGAIPFKLSKKLNPNQDLITPSYGKKFTKNSVFDSDNFKSEIDWGKWNKEIPENTQLMKEYNTIEKTSKANGSWMKNPDGSAFQGTPEQFVQQNSSNFKNAFGNSKLVNPDGSPTIQYHGSAKKFDTFDESKFQLGDSGYSGQGIYTSPSKTTADSYAISSAKFHKGDIEPTVYELYGQANNPISSSQLIKENKDRDLFNFHRERNWQGELSSYESLKEYDAAISDQLRNVQNIRPWYDAREVVFPTNKQLKSAIGNNGMFDMTNPNIYKGLVPLGVAAGMSQQKQQYGGAHYNKNLNYILPNSLLDEKNEDVEEPVFKLKKKEIKGDKRNGYSAYEQNGEIYMDNINDEPIKQHETFHYLRSKGYFSPREQAIENELLDGSIYSPLDKNKLNSDIYSPEELAARFHSISGYLPNNYKEEDFKKLWETGKDLQIQDLKQVIPYDKALYYMNNYHPSKMQMGGMVSKDSSNLKEIKKQRDWLRAWYGERDVVTEPIEIFENELKSVNGSKTKDPEILKQNEEFREWGKKTNFDVSAYYHTPSDRSVFLKDVTGTTDPIHEFTHSIDNNYGDNIGTFNSINPFHPLKTDYTKLGVKPIKENDYFTNTEETYARLNEARYSSGYAANYKPTLEDIKEQRRLNKKNKPKAYNHLFDYYDDNSIMQMWNGLSDTRFEESSVENPMLQQTAKYGIKKQFGGGSSILKQLQLL